MTIDYTKETNPSDPGTICQHCGRRGAAHSYASTRVILHIVWRQRGEPASTPGEPAIDACLFRFAPGKGPDTEFLGRVSEWPGLVE